MKHLNYKGAADAGHFEYYNGEANEKFDLKDLAVTAVKYTIKGWDEASNSAIYSNDITDWKEELILDVFFKQILQNYKLFLHKQSSLFQIM